jgi:hypothetical protein
VVGVVIHNVSSRDGLVAIIQFIMATASGSGFGGPAGAGGSAGFTLPTEFADFVSSAQTLQEEFKLEQADDLLTYKVYFRHDGDPIAVTVEDAELLLSRIRPFVEELIKDYVWNLDSFHLQLVVPDADSDDLVHFQGQMRTGGNVEDEWFVVYVLQSLSRTVESIACSVCDTDGEFLLIEAADQLPNWLGPENSKNRVWIQRGEIIIIGIEDVSPDRRDVRGISVKSALQWIWADHHHVHNYVNMAIQSCIDAKTTLQYPAKTKAIQHNAVCVLPRVVAAMLHNYPQLLSYAVAAFCSPQSKDLKKHLAKMKVLSRSSNNSVDADNSPSPLEDLVVSTVQFSKVAYAQMKFKPFQTPRAMHTVWRSATAILGPSVGSDIMDSGSSSNPSQQPYSSGIGTKLRQALELGCRLCCGVELAFHASVKQRTAATDLFPSQIVSVSTVNLGSTLTTSDDTYDAVINIRTHPMQRVRVCDAINSVLDRKNECKSVSNGVSVSATTTIAVLKQINNGGDDTLWLYLTPEQLEEHIQSQIGEISLSEWVSGMSLSEEKQQRSNPSVQGHGDVANLDSLVSSMKSFMEGTSDVRGVTSHREPEPNELTASTAFPAPGSSLLRAEFMGSVNRAGDEEVLKSSSLESLCSEKIAALVKALISPTANARTVEQDIARALSSELGLSLSTPGAVAEVNDQTSDNGLKKYFYDEDLDVLGEVDGDSIDDSDDEVVAAERKQDKGKRTGNPTARETVVNKILTDSCASRSVGVIGAGSFFMSLDKEEGEDDSDEEQEERESSADTEDNSDVADSDDELFFEQYQVNHCIFGRTIESSIINRFHTCRKLWIAN